MFEITGEDIMNLDDDVLRTLVARLCVAELYAAKSPISGVTAGGHQDSPDGGIDVRVECSDSSYTGDFIPRVPTGFQVKKPDMGPAAIRDEMAPKGNLRPVIVDLAQRSGSYIIVSSSGTVADSFLVGRRQAMRDALQGLPYADQLQADFYDRERLAVWVNRFPGVAAWTRAQVGRNLSGWESLGQWKGAKVERKDSFIVDEKATLTDARSSGEEHYAILDGLKLIRNELRKPRTCVRLIGVSGLGKTRFVKALFEDEVGEAALDPSIALYTDYSEDPNPTAKQLAQSLIEQDQRAILVVDNCNPQLHRDLAEICDRPGSKVSLLTVEYDVKTDEPERTEVFRLGSSSEATIVEWLTRNFGHITNVDRDRIADFSGGNFRVARVLAETVKQGDNLGQLTDRELFQRIFLQRNDADGQLLRCAETLAMVYSFNGEDTGEESELAVLAGLANIDADTLYEASVELQKRELVQARGRWRAVLPQAIANRLASEALERISPSRLDGFIAGLPPRLAKSFCRRLGYLHKNEKAQQVAKELLEVTGPLGDLISLSDEKLQMLRSIAPVVPEAVFNRIEQAVSGPAGESLLNPTIQERWQLIELLRSLAYDPELFRPAALLLSRFFMAEEPDENTNSASDAFEGLFALYLSGTNALPVTRRELVESLFSEHETKRAGMAALRAMLKTGHFSSAANFDFGARSRGFGWEPKTYGDTWNWYAEAIALARRLLGWDDLRNEIGAIVANEIRGLLGNEPTFRELEAFADKMLEFGAWIDGWRAIKFAQRFDQDDWPPELKQEVDKLEAKLRPSDLSSEIEAWVLSGRGIYDLVEAESDDDSKSWDQRYAEAADRAKGLGVLAANDPDFVERLLPRLLAGESNEQVFHFGMGLAEGFEDTEKAWSLLIDSFEKIAPEARTGTLPGGFLSYLAQASNPLANDIADDCLTRESLKPWLVYFQFLLGFDERGVERLWKAIDQRSLRASEFMRLASGSIRKFPKDRLPKLLERVAAMENGVPVAVRIAHFAIYYLRSDENPVEEVLLETSRGILLQCEFTRSNDYEEHTIKELVKFCFENGKPEVELRELADVVLGLVRSAPHRAWEYENILTAIFGVSPKVALDKFLLEPSVDEQPAIGSEGWLRSSPVTKLELSIIWEWADEDPDTRYPIIAGALEVFPNRIAETTTEISPLFLEALERAPSCQGFLSAASSRLWPSGWSGSLVAILDRRISALKKLEKHSDPTVKSWCERMITNLTRMAAGEREREAESEERFE